MQYLYLIKCQQYYKIGIASDIQSRLAQLSTGNPFDLEVLAVYGFESANAVETAIHQRYAEVRKRGEWFALDEHDIEDIGSICRMLGGIKQIANGLPTDCEIEEAEEIQDGLSEWIELIKVNSWYYLRVMRWDAESRKKVYVINLGNLDECKRNPEYSEIAFRLEALRLKEDEP